MNIVQAEENLKKITANFSKESFIFDLMGAYDFPKATISRLQKGSLDKAKNENEVVLKKKFYFISTSKKDLDSIFEKAIKDNSILKHDPRFIIVIDNKSLKAYDTKVGEKLDTEITNLSKHPDFFLPWAGIEKKVFQGENPADVKAAEKLAKFYDLILQDNVKLFEKNSHALNVFLIRILFCFFAEDTEIFEKDLFTKSINDHTNKDGNDVADYLKMLFEVLNKKSRAGLPDYLKEFPYVNGGLFAEEFPIPTFSKRSRESLIDLGSDLNWAEINPDIFGSMIQAVSASDKRGDLGQHYTSVPNIMKVIDALFLTELKEEFEQSRANKSKLKKLLERISNIKIFDPACGSGNFLIIAYKELRYLEMNILKELGSFNFSTISLSNFYGIEIDDFAHEVAKLSLWLAEHQVDLLFNHQFGNVKPSLPLKESGKIICGNAARVEWSSVCTIENEEIYVIGNPPYLGARLQQAYHKEDMQDCLVNVDDVNNLDYISIWFHKGANYIRGKNARLAFVSTNSISQGAQVEGLWPHILKDNIEIGFAYEDFKWGNNAKGNAGVSCVIIGLRNCSKDKKYIYCEGLKKEVKNINAYLIDFENIYVKGRNIALSNLPSISFGSMANDGGSLILSGSEYRSAVEEEPEIKKYLKKLYGSDEFINGVERYCIWISSAEEFSRIKSKFLLGKVEACKMHRLKSKRGATAKLANIPYRFAEARYKETHCIIIPKTSSEKRAYIPIGFLGKEAIVTDGAFAVYDAQEYIFSILTSHMHMTWVRHIGGQLETRLRYSAEICYNTFPIPDLSVEEKNQLKNHALEIMKEREKFSDSTLAILYDQDNMPDSLLDAHQRLDQFVDRIYSPKGFKNDLERITLLFKMYSEKIKES